MSQLLKEIIILKFFLVDKHTHTMIRLKQLFLKLISFSKTEANGAVVLMLLIFFCLASPSIYRSAFGIRYSHFQEDKALLDSLIFKMDKAVPVKEAQPIELKLFDPNSATVEELISLGIPSFLSRRIENYRNGGGQFQLKSDLSKIYDFPDSLFRVLVPYINLPETRDTKAEKPRSIQKLSRNSAASTYKSVPRYDESPLLIDINKADSTEFQKLYGIGPAYARRIVAFREALGGYYAVDQIQTLYGMTDSLFLQIKSFLHVSDTVSLKVININIATYRQLIAHPYINQDLTKEILAAKSKYGKFKEPEDLKRLNLIDSIGRAKLLPYIKF